MRRVGPWAAASVPCLCAVAGNARLRARTPAATSALPTLCAGAQAAGAGLTIGQAHTDAGSWLELTNPGAEAVDVSGWALTGDVDFTFRPGEQLVKTRSAHGLSGVMGKTAP